MKNTFLIVAATTAIAVGTDALAGNNEPVATPAPIISPAVTPTAVVADWSGAYAGLSYNSISGTTGYVPGNGPFDFIDADEVGIFGGYNWQRGSLVYGGELSYMDHGVGLVSWPNESAGSIIELRGRGGYAFGNALAYGFLGYAASDYTTSTGTWDVSGASYGVGLDYLITDSVFAGLEFSRRQMSGETENLGQDQDTTVNAISLRFGYKF
jgi:outer membrane immunogenic protein